VIFVENLYFFIRNLYLTPPLVRSSSKYCHNFGIGKALVCFYDAEHVLTMIAKFLVRLFRVEEGRGGMAGGG